MIASVTFFGYRVALEKSKCNRVKVLCRNRYSLKVTE
jgi:hypothetical protein